VLEPDEVKRLTALATSDPNAFGAEARQRALEAYDRREWYGIYAWTKSWITSGGGARMVDAWLLYVVSTLRQGQPRGAIHSTDLALRNWMEAPEDRAILLWVRAAVVHRRLKDPKTALADYVAAKERAPDWLAERIDSDSAQCAKDASSSRKRKPSVGPSPDYEDGDRTFVAGTNARREPGSMPTVWQHLLDTLADAQQPST
jgi:hypothetical protein